MSKSKTFFEALQIDTDLDLRDNRGKVHDIALILTEFVIALLCNRDGNMSSIWRHMRKFHQLIIKELNIETTAPKKQYLVLIYHYY